MPPALEIALLGPPRVRRGGDPVVFDTRKAMALLAHLTLADRPRSREALCELLWPERDPEHARGALRRTLSTLRRSIGEQYLDTAGDSVALAAGDGLEVDVARFRALAAGDVDALAAAVAMFRGELLEGFSVRDNPGFDAWCLREADVLQRELATALGRLVRALAERGDYTAAIRHARRWLALDPLHEPAHQELIRLHALDGNRAAALAQYRDCVRALSQELGVGPLESTAALFEQVSDGALAAPAPPPARRAPAVPSRELPLVGREAELAALGEALAAVGDDGRTVVLEGEAGIGKSRLAREFLAGVDGLVLAARCHEDETRLPYGPVLELLADAHRVAADAVAAAVPARRRADAALLVPELAPDGPEAPPLTGPAAQARLFEAVTAVLSVARVVFVDDLHAADEATLDVLTYLARRLRGRPLLLVLAWRGESVPLGHRLRRLDATVLALERLAAQDVEALAGEPDAARRVFADSEGLPLLVAEHLAALAAGGTPGHGMRELVAARVAGLDAATQQLLETAAVIGRSFAFETVRRASGRGDEEVTDGLDALVARGLVRELPADEPTYDFTHGKVRDLVYERTGRARRRLLHGRVADALLRSGGTPAAVAQHLRLGGDRAAAAEQHRVAAEHAAAVLAFRDALEHLDTALELGVTDEVAVHERMGDLRTLAGDYTRALTSYETAAASAPPAALGRLEHKLGGVHQRRGEWERAQARFAVALETLAPDDRGARARILTDLGLTQHQLGMPDRAAAVAQEARALAEAAGDQHALAQAHNLLGMLARDAGQLDFAHLEFQQSLRIAERLGDMARRTAALNNLALVARESGDTERAERLTRDALALCVALGDRHREAALENNLADLHHAAGRTEESMAHLKRAVALFADVDGEAQLPEVWKLASW